MKNLLVYKCWLTLKTTTTTLNFFCGSNRPKSGRSVFPVLFGGTREPVRLADVSSFSLGGKITFTQMMSFKGGTGKSCTMQLPR